MTALCRNVNRLTNLMEQFLVPLSWAGFVRLKFTKARIPAKMFEVSPSDHARYNGNPDCPHQLHIITRIKCTKRRPYWEKKIVHDLGLDKHNFFIEELEIRYLGTWYVGFISTSHQPRIHKNVPSINNKLKVIKHLIRVQPLKLPQGLPTEQELADSYLKSTGELIIRRHLQPLE